MLQRGVCRKRASANHGPARGDLQHASDFGKTNITNMFTWKTNADVFLKCFRWLLVKLDCACRPNWPLRALSASRALFASRKDMSGAAWLTWSSFNMNIARACRRTPPASAASQTLCSVKHRTWRAILPLLDFTSNRHRFSCTSNRQWATLPRNFTSNRRRFFWTSLLRDISSLLSATRKYLLNFLCL